MPVTQVQVDQITRDRLGEEAVASLRRRFDVTGECQSCKQGLGDGPVAVVVAELGWAQARANAHHVRCSDPEWQSGVIELRSDAQITHWTMCFTLPGESEDGTFDLPIFVLHPALDQIVLVKDGGTWRVDTFYGLTGQGLTAPDPYTPMFQMLRPVAGWKIPHLTDREVAVTAPESVAVWRGWVTPDFAMASGTHDGTVVIVNTTIDPSTMPNGITGAQVNELLASVETASGWISLSGQTPEGSAATPVGELQSAVWTTEASKGPTDHWWISVGGSQGDHFQRAGLITFR